MISSNKTFLSNFDHLTFWGPYLEIIQIQQCLICNLEQSYDRLRLIMSSCSISIKSHFMLRIAYLCSQKHFGEVWKKNSVGIFFFFLWDEKCFFIFFNFFHLIEHASDIFGLTKDHCVDFHNRGLKKNILDISWPPHVQKIF